MSEVNRKLGEIEYELLKQKKRIKRLLKLNRGYQHEPFERFEERIRKLEEKESNNQSNDLRERVKKIEGKIETIIVKLEERNKTVGAKNNQVFPRNQNIPNNRLSRVKTVWNKFASSTTFHGISKVASIENMLIKTIWIVLVTLSFSGGVINMLETINDYYKFDVITNVERVTAKSITFPAITLCTPNFVEKRHYNSSSNTSYFSTNFTSLSNILGEIRFGDKIIDKSEIEYFRIPKYFGNCLRFNGFNTNDPLTFNLKTFDHTSDSFALNILEYVAELLLDNEYIVENLRSNYFDAYVTDNYLNSYFSVPLYLHGGTIRIAKAEVETKLPAPYNDCTETVDKTYRHANCVEKCINKQIKDRYNCSIPSYYTIGGLKECGGELYIEGSKDLILNSYIKRIDLIQNLLNESLPSCENECPKECESVIFDSIITTEVDRYFHFSFYHFSTLNITQIPKMNEFSFVSNIGGSLGLFLGISFLSFMELLEFLIDVFLVISYF